MSDCGGGTAAIRKAPFKEDFYQLNEAPLFNTDIDTTNYYDYTSSILLELETNRLVRGDSFSFAFFVVVGYMVERHSDFRLISHPLRHDDMS